MRHFVDQRWLGGGLTIAGLAIGVAVYALGAAWEDRTASSPLTIPEAQAKSEALHACLEAAASANEAAACRIDAAVANRETPWLTQHRWPSAVGAAIDVVIVGR